MRRTSGHYRMVFAALLCISALDLAAQDVLYSHQQRTGVARAFCPTGATLLGGGGFSETPPRIREFREEKLRQTYPISDSTGVIAFGTSGIGWQVASSDFTGNVASFAVCAKRPLASKITVQYEFAQAIGVARAFCPVGTTVVGGGGFVETLDPAAGFMEERLRQTHPISDAIGTFAFGSTAVGWQAASSDFQDTVVAFAVCAAPTLPTTALDVEYVSAQNVGVARAYCPTGRLLTGGGALVETSPSNPSFAEETLRQTYPISDTTGVIAHGPNAIGWQAASSDFEDDVVAFAICMAPVP